MSTLPSETGNLANEYILKNPTMPSRTMARLICREHPGYRVEDIRSIIRYYRGTCGEGNRIDHGIIEMPKTDNKPWPAFVIPEQYSNTWIFADAHIPYHDIESFLIFIKKAHERNIDSIIIDGDLIDFYLLSKFCRNPSRRSVPLEIKAVNEFLDFLEDEFPNAKIFYKTANHEFRLDRFIMTHAPELFEMDGLNLASQLDVNARGITLISDKRIVKYGHLNILHGDEIPGGGILAGQPRTRIVFEGSHNGGGGPFPCSIIAHGTGFEQGEHNHMEHRMHVRFNAGLDADQSLGERVRLCRKGSIREFQIRKFQDNPGSYLSGMRRLNVVMGMVYQIYRGTVFESKSDG